MDIGISFVLGIVSIISAAVAVASVVISHRQSREQARQTKVGAENLELNSAAFNLDVDGQFTDGLREVLNHFVERPELRQYFTDEVDCSDAPRGRASPVVACDHRVACRPVTGR